MLAAARMRALMPREGESVAKQNGQRAVAVRGGAQFKTRALQRRVAGDPLLLSPPSRDGRLRSDPLGKDG